MGIEDEKKKLGQTRLHDSLCRLWDQEAAVASLWLQRLDQRAPAVAVANRQLVVGSR